jgi:carbon storage regulator
MLILSRNKGEKIVIGEGKSKVTIIVKEINPRSKRCRIGIEAPAEVPVHRQEVYDSIHNHQG